MSMRLSCGSGTDWLGKSAAPEQILKNVRRSVDVFVEKTEQFDDLTMLCLEYRSAKSVAEENRP